MKLGTILLAGLLLVITPRTYPLVQMTDNQAHQQWLEERYKEAVSIKPGMSRADLMKLFDEDGGVQPIPAARYVLKNCHLIQIEVKFDTEYGVNHEPTPDANLKIVEVSRPYLARMAVD